MCILATDNPAIGIDEDMADVMEVPRQAPNVPNMTSTPSSEPTFQFSSLSLQPQPQTPHTRSMATGRQPLENNITNKRPAATALEPTTSSRPVKAPKQAGPQDDTSSTTIALQPNGQLLPCLQPLHDLVALAEASARVSNAPPNFDPFVYAITAQNHISQQGGAGNKTPQDVLEHFATGRYSARPVAGVNISVHASIVTNDNGEMQCSPKSYAAARCPTIKALKKAAAQHWERHFRACRVKMPEGGVDLNRITVELAESHGPRLIPVIANCEEAVTEVQYLEWFDRNVVHGRDPTLSVGMTYDLGEPLTGDDLFA
ncbi:hypothetical protein OHC33_008667 [Knufia fluminis]|uniref:Uncharacterized protein n=1 Tax=Knufia fluminis TaxID=191047 RepID=A0AAN8EA07_9EURO|nr:hypothetical protein OHC33_008667 [Knufia fluminis]